MPIPLLGATRMTRLTLVNAAIVSVKLATATVRARVMVKVMLRVKDRFRVRAEK